MGAPSDAETVSPLRISDEALVQRLRAGDTHAGESLARRHFEPLMRYLQRLVGTQIAEELYQQTWLSVLEHLDRFDPGTRAPENPASPTAAPTTGREGGGNGSFKAWLFRIATNKANDHWRSGGREKAAKEGLKLIVDEQLPGANFRMEGAEQEQKLLAALQQLPDPQRQVLLLRFYGNMKFVEIAELLGCPLNTALGRAHKAILKLRQLMGD